MHPLMQERRSAIPHFRREAVQITECRAQSYEEASNSGGTLNVHDPPGDSHYAASRRDVVQFSKSCLETATSSLPVW
jgi:hypothetical protein